MFIRSLTFPTPPFFQVWMTLLESNSVPVRRIIAVAELAADRLRDKAVNVSESCLVMYMWHFDCILYDFISIYTLYTAYISL